MALIPLEFVTLKTKLSPPDVEKRLNEYTEPRKWHSGFLTAIGMHKPIKPLIGKIKGTKFTVLPNTRDRSFLFPVVTGAVHPDGQGSEVRIFSRVNIFAFIIPAIILSLVFLTPAWIWVKIGVCVLLYLLIIAGYNSEFAHVRETMERLLTAGTRNDEDERPGK
ncbi:MAG: hypothetical protein AABZ39_19255 [Spirochaetota bacterium]